MAFIREDLVRESSTTTGTGNFTLAGALTPGRTFASVMANNDTTHYVIAHQTLNEWETGLGTWTTGNVLVRTTPLESSNAGAAVNFSAGTKNVEMVLPTAEINPVASETVAGLAEIVTAGEAAAKTDDARILTALKAAGVFFSVLNVQEFSAGGTVTATTGMKWCFGILTASGGGSGGSDSSTTTNDIGVGGAGGAGGTRIGFFSAATFGASQTLTLPAGGTAGSNAGGNGGAASNATLGALLTAIGGLGGIGSGTETNHINAELGGDGGGAGSGGLFGAAGGDGGSSFGFAMDGTLDGTIASAGDGGTSLWGGGGRGGVLGSTTLGVSAVAAGRAGQAPGSGAGGTICSDTTGGQAGAVGATGKFVLIEFA